MTREDAATRGRRYLVEGRLTVTLVHGDVVEAQCRGSGEVHELGHKPGRGWWCTCPARGRCSHLQALTLVTVRRKP